MRPRPLLLGLPPPLSAGRRRPALALVLVLGLAMSPIVAASGVGPGARPLARRWPPRSRTRAIRNRLRRRSRNRSGSPPNTRAPGRRRRSRAPRPRRRFRPTGRSSRSRRSRRTSSPATPIASPDVFVRNRVSGITIIRLPALSVDTSFRVAGGPRNPRSAPDLAWVQVAFTSTPPPSSEVPPVERRRSRSC